MSVHARLGRRATTLVVAAFISGATGCGGGGGGSAGPAEIDDADRIRFTVNPGVLDFGKTVVGRTVSGTLVVNNSGGRRLDITVSAPGEGFVLTQTCGSLAPQQSCTLAFEFSPTEQRAYSSTINVDSAGVRLSPTLQGIGQGLSVQITTVANQCTDATFLASLSVTGADSDPILGLRSENVTAFLNDVEVDPVGELRAIDERETVAAGLVLDWSSSLADVRPNIVDASRVFIESLGLEAGGLVDRAGVFKFSAEVDGNAQDFVDADAAGRDVLLESLTRDFAGSETGSNIWGATEFVVGEVANQPNPIRAAVLLSDGRDNGSLTLSELIDSAQAQDTRIFAIGFGDLNPGPLNRLAEETGGLFFSDPDASGLMEIFSRIAAALTNRYEIAFENPLPDSAGQLRIAIRDDAGLEGDDTFTIAACP